MQLANKRLHLTGNLSVLRAHTQFCVFAGTFVRFGASCREILAEYSLTAGPDKLSVVITAITIGQSSTPRTILFYLFEQRSAWMS